MNFDADFNLKTLGPLSGSLSIEADCISDSDRAFEINPVQRCCYPFMKTMHSCLDEGSLVNHAEYDAAEYGSIHIRISRHHDLSNGA